MLVLSAIESSKSAWSSPIILTGKPGNPLCFCNDFSKVNEVSEFDAYPMAHVNEQWVHSYPWSQWGILVGSEDKIAFVPLRRPWHHLMAPFCLCSDPTTFHRLIDQVLKPPPTICMWQFGWWLDPEPRLGKSLTLDAESHRVPQTRRLDGESQEI